MGESKSNRAVLIAGPTASGKSALALALARERNGVIINADAMQVYRQLCIITARPTHADEAEVPHRMYGYVNGDADYSVGAWLQDARREIEGCWSTGQTPIICGGTGLYFMALEQGIAEVPPISAQIRDKWRQFDGDVHLELTSRDPATALRLNPADRQRIKRALEVMEDTGQSLAWWQEQGRSGAVLADAQAERIFVDVPRDELYARADQRFDAMLEAGALEEVRRLPAFDASQPIMKAIGVPELLAVMAGTLSLDQARDKAKTATRNYIKRQLTWWRGQMKEWRSV